jgi:hypothetical protein
VSCTGISGDSAAGDSEPTLAGVEAGAGGSGALVGAGSGASTPACAVISAPSRRFQSSTPQVNAKLTAAVSGKAIRAFISNSLDEDGAVCRRLMACA